MKVVVTGGAGFIASHVVDAYLALGHEVLVVDDLSTGLRANLAPAARLVEADIRSEAAATAVRDFAPRVLCLHAAQIDVRRSVREPRFDADVNVGGALNLLEAARLAGQLERVVYAASGGSMYGDTLQVPTPETAPILAVSPYGVSKAACELYLQCYQSMYALHHVALRYANIYGPRQNAHGEAGVVAIFTERLLAGQRCTIHGDGLQTRDFVHVADVARANVLALTTPASGGFNVGTGVETDVRTIHTLIARAAGVPDAPTFGEAKLGEQRRSVLDNRKAAQVLGFTPAIDVARGIEDTVAWFKARR